MEKVLEIKDLSYKRRRKVILNHFHLAVNEGCIYALVGAHLSGKTTLQKILASQLAYSSGEVLIYGRKDTFGHHNEIGSNLLSAQEDTNVLGYVSSAASLHKVRHPKDEAMKILSMMHLDQIALRAIRDCSDSERHLLKIAAAVAGFSPLVCIDEPFDGLSDDDKRMLKGVLENLRDDKKISFLLTSHVLSDLEDFSDQIGIIKDGQLACEMDRDVLKEKLIKEIHVRVNDVPKAQEILGYGTIHDDWLILDHGDAPTINRTLLKNGLHVYEIKIVREAFTHYFNTALGGEK